MDSDEREIFEYLKTFGEDWVAAREVCRRAGGKRRYSQDNNWAIPILQRMKEQSLLEGDELGRYRIKPKPKGHKGRWVSPEIEKILKESDQEPGRKPKPKGQAGRWVSPDFEKILRENAGKVDAEQANAASEKEPGQA